MKLKSLILNALLCLALASPSFAASKSTTVQASCFVPPMLNLSSPALMRSSAVDPGYKMTEEFRQDGAGRIKLYSLTAL